MSEVRDATLRLQSRQQNERHRRWLRWGIVGLVVALLAACGWLVWLSPVFAVRTIAVTGVDLVDRGDVLSAAQVQKGASMVTLETDLVAERVAGLPAVASVTVVRDWPDTIKVTVKERTARLAIPAGGGYLLADAHGIAFRAVRTAPGGLVVVEADPEDQRVLVDVGTVFSALSPQTAKRVSRLAAPSRDGIELRLTDGSKVIWGSADDSATKSEVLDALLGLGGTEFNVSAPGFPTRR